MSDRENIPAFPFPGLKAEEGRTSLAPAPIQQDRTIVLGSGVVQGGGFVLGGGFMLGGGFVTP